MTKFKMSVRDSNEIIQDAGIEIEADTWLDAINWYLKYNPLEKRQNVLAEEIF